MKIRHVQEPKRRDMSFAAVVTGAVLSGASMAPGQRSKRRQRPRRRIRRRGVFAGSQGYDARFRTGVYQLFGSPSSPEILCSGISANPGKGADVLGAGLHSRVKLGNRQVELPNLALIDELHARDKLERLRYGRRSSIVRLGFSSGIGVPLASV